MRNHEGSTEPAYKPRLRVKLAVVAASVVFALLVFEVFLRLVGFTYPVFYRPDEARGYALMPGAQGWYRKEGEAYVRVNGEGLHDREHAKEKAANTLRVAVLGDSYAEAFQVGREKAFWAVAESRLRACAGVSGREVEFINFGVSGYGTAQELITLREKVWDYSPDVVLLAITTNNDVLDNSRALKLTDEIPYFVLDGERLAPDNSFRDTAAFRLRDSALNRAGRALRDNLRFVQAAHHGHAVLKSKLTTWRQRRDASRRAQQNAQRRQADAQAKGGGAADARADAAADEPGVANLIYREPSDDVWRDAWRVTERLLTTMSGEVAARGAKFYAVTLSNGIQVYPDPAGREAFTRRLGVSDLFYAERRFRALGEREGFTVFNLAPDLQLYADERRTFLHGFPPAPGNGHWNEEGHRVAGELLAKKLCDELSK